MVKEKLTIVKIGGHVIDADEQLSLFLKSFASLTGHKILLHGGGKLATQLADRLGIPQQMVDGRRVTDAETLKVVTMVYAGLINKNVVAQLQSLNSNAIGLTGADANIIQAHKRSNSSIDYGFAGDIDLVNSESIKELLDRGLQLVIAPITHDKLGQLLNTNADTLANEIAVAMSAHYEVSLIYCFERNGVLRDPANEGSVIEAINQKNFEVLKSLGVISGGMIPKLKNALDAVEAGVSSVTIGHAKNLTDLALQKAGTTILHD